MHLNYHFFKHLGAPLQKKLVGKQLLACFSQEKDELVLGFGDSSGDFYIRVSVLGSFSGLYFTTDFKRAKKNSVDLFQGFIHSEVEDLYLFENERAIEIKLSGEKAILLKMFGNRSNVLGLINDSVIEVFNNKLPDDRKIIPAQLNRTVIQTFE
jgi:predicted ribosome quality control (RQC) complex YloA/Tae2 family protein